MLDTFQQRSVVVFYYNTKNLTTQELHHQYIDLQNHNVVNLFLTQGVLQIELLF